MNIIQVDFSTRVAATVASVVVGFHMYAVNADKHHLPSVWINESLRSAWAAVVAAPILKLCL